MLDVDPARVVSKGRLQPGRMFLVDTAQGRIVDDDEIKAELAAEQPYGEWLDAGLVHLDDLPAASTSCPSHESRAARQQIFGYTQEELQIISRRWRATGVEPIGSMGTDTPIAGALRPAAAAVRLLQPAVRAGHQPAARRHPRGARHLARRHDRRRGQPARPGPGRAARSCCRSRSSTTTSWPSSSTSTTTATCPASRRAWSPACTAVAGGGDGAARRRSTASAPRSATAIAGGRATSSCSPTATPTPSWRRSRRCCSPSAVHHHLIREKTRTQVGLVVETGDAREVHHLALLLGYGAGAINPYLAFETDRGPDRDERRLTGDRHRRKAVENYIKAAARACSR